MTDIAYGSRFPIKRIILSAVIFFFLVLAGSGTELSWRDWVSLDPGIEDAWNIRPDPDGLGVLVSSKAAAENVKLKKLLVLFPKKSSAYDTALEILLQVFSGKGIPAGFYLYYFANQPDAGSRVLARAENEQFDLVYSMGSSATAFVHEHYLNGRLPVVSVCSKDPVLLGQTADYATGSSSNIAYTSLNVPVRLQVEYLLKFNSELEHIIILYAVNNTSAVETQVKPLKAACREHNIKCYDLAVENQSGAASELAAKLPAAVQVVKSMDRELEKSIFWITGSTSVFREIAVINKFADKIPVLSVVPDVVQAGDDSAVLSIGVGFESNAHLAALYGVQIITGQQQAGDLEVGIVTPPDIAINMRKARQIGLKIPFVFFESATILYDYDGQLVRKAGKEGE